jgi:hypothetical protein
MENRPGTSPNQSISMEGTETQLKTHETTILIPSRREELQRRLKPPKNPRKGSPRKNYVSDDNTIPVDKLMKKE